MAQEGKGWGKMKGDTFHLLKRATMLKGSLSSKTRKHGTVKTNGGEEGDTAY